MREGGLECVRGGHRKYERVCCGQYKTSLYHANSRVCQELCERDAPVALREGLR